MALPLRVAIAGTGFIGAVHARSAQRVGARLIGVAASSPERSAAAATALGAERSFDSAEELVESDDVDVVHICTPNYLHVELAERALAAGKHVICEKPLALDAESAHRVAEAAAAAPGTSTIPFVYRYYPTVREARERVRAGATGSLRLMHGTYLQDWLLSAEDDNWRVSESAGGPSRAFADIGSHWCDLVEFVSGHRISRLVAQTMTAHPERREAAHRPAFGRDGEGAGAAGPMRKVETEDVAVVQFETDRGAIGSTVVSQVSPGRKNRLWLELDGERESLVFDQENPETLWCGRREAATIVTRDPALLSPPAARLATLPGGHPQGYGDCFDAFVADAYAAILSGEAVDGLPGFVDGLRAAEVTDAVLRSAAEGEWVDVARKPVGAAG
jgi:predicted dehydrogenase